MFAVSREKKKISPIQSQFFEFWIYDLRSFHSFWLQKVQSEASIYTGESVWSALFKAYGFSAFTELDQTKDFALSYHQYFENSVSPKNLESLYAHFYRLGISKIGHLRKLPRSQLQKRFGKVWAEFLCGLCSPDQADWNWKAFREDPIYSFSFEPEFILTDYPQLLQFCASQLYKLAETKPEIRIEKMKVSLLSPQSEDDLHLNFYFAHHPVLSKEIQWLQRSLEERMAQIKLQSAIQKIEFHIESPKSTTALQLQLFESSKDQMEWKELMLKLNSIGFHAFQPSLLNSHLPESSWEKSTEPDLKILIQDQIYDRPLIQMEAKKIQEPAGQLYFTERVDWLDESGKSKRRDYFILFEKRKWIWVYQDEENSWYQQGIAE